MTITMHLCRGNFRSSWIAQGGYEPVAEIAVQPDRSGRLLHGIRQRTRRRLRTSAIRALRTRPVVLGLVTSKAGALESADELERRIRRRGEVRRSRTALPESAVRVRQHRRRQRAHRGGAVGQTGAHRRSRADSVGRMTRTIDVGHAAGRWFLDHVPEDPSPHWPRSPSSSTASTFRSWVSPFPR